MSPEAWGTSGVGVAILVVGFLLNRSIAQVDKKLEDTALDVKALMVTVGMSNTALAVLQSQRLEDRREIDRHREDLHDLRGKVQAAWLRLDKIERSGDS
jgi:Tfp pilus assembly PilM family ATPase